MTMKYIQEQVKKAQDRDLAEQNKEIYEAMIVLLETGRVQKPDGDWVSISAIQLSTPHLLVLRDMWNRAKSAEKKVDYLTKEVRNLRKQLIDKGTKNDTGRNYGK